MKVNIYYGGRGLIDDPTIFAMNKVGKVLEELNIQVMRYNLYEDKRGISVLPKTLKEADAVVLAASIEWMGIGGLLWQFLDSCWLYGDKEKISRLYMMPVVISTTYGEKDAQFTMVRAWEMLGGIPCDGICAYINDSVKFETSSDYSYLIEKKTENFYRIFSKKISSFPSSTKAVKENVLRPKSITLTPQESEQLSEYVSNDSYVKRQKEDIQELTQMFKRMMGDDKPYLDKLQKAFHAVPNVAVSFSWECTELKETLFILVDNDKLDCHYGGEQKADAMIKSDQAVMAKVMNGEETLQNAFMSGEVTAKGNFKLLNTFDSLFRL
ncbi:MAG: SCP2 sterol-binding domain-containing protein [Lachnospiraceae bacterium]|nr:SCP2 sterol-binding domain-containing protein [Lachnospiraceae bacterium]